MTVPVIPESAPADIRNLKNGLLDTGSRRRRVRYDDSNRSGLV